MPGLVMGVECGWVELSFDLRHSNSGQRLLAQIQVGEENQRYDCLA